MEGIEGHCISGVYDAVVVGAGIMGSCIAYEIAKRGKSVLLVEQYDLLHRRGSSHGESRTIRVTYPEEYYTGMMLESYKLWEEAQKEAGYSVYYKTGQLDFGTTDSKSFAAVITSLNKFGVAHELLNAEQLAERHPMFSLPDDSWLALYTEQGGILRASKAVAMFQALAVKHGANLRDRAKVLKISRDRSAADGSEAVLVATSRGTALGQKCILAAGAWTRKLVKSELDLDLPVQPLHTTLAYWGIEEKEWSCFEPNHGCPVFATYNHPYIYGTPSVEYPGLIKVSYHSGTNCDPDNRSVGPDRQALKEIVTPWLMKTFKGKVQSEAPVLADGCMYSMTPDEDFILDFLSFPSNNDANHESHSPILVAAGFSGHGFKMAPLVGRIMADLALTGTDTTGTPIDLFSFRRFLKNPMGNHKQHEDQVIL